MGYDKLASREVVERTRESLEKKGYDVILVKSGEEALNSLSSLIPEGASVNQGSSVTLEQIGLGKWLESGNSKWIDLKARIKAESDKSKRAKLRRESVLSDYYLGSVHALAESGEFIVASNTGSQLPHVVFTTPNLIFVVSIKKIVPTLDEAMRRVREYVLPLEERHLMEAYNVHTGLNKMLLFLGEASVTGRKIHFILVEEDLGF